MKKLSLSPLMTITLFVAAGVVANADTLNGSGSWQSWTPATLGTAGSPTYGGPFWNNLSGDGATNNIGWCFAGGGGCSMPNAPGALQYFGNGTSAVNTMSFNSGGSGVTLSLAGVFTTQTTIPLGLDYFGYYTLNSSGVVTSPTPLFNAGNALATAISVNIGPNTNYGFYIENVQGQGTTNETDYWFYMDTTQDTTNRGITLTPFQHVAVFNNGANGYYLGLEDSISGIGDSDYNDLVVQMNVSGNGGAPEPASAGLAAIGLLSCALFLYRLRLNRGK